MSSTLETQLNSSTTKSLVRADTRPWIDGLYDTGIDFLEINKPLDVRPEGLSVIENNDRSTWRWGLGPCTSLKFSLTHPQKLILKVAFESPFEGQSVVVTHNDTALAELEGSGLEQEVAIHATLQNTISLEYSDWDQPPKRFPDDPRPLATQYSCLTLVSGDGAPFSFPSETPSFPHLGSPIENEDLARREYADGKTVLRSLPPIVTLALTTRCNIQKPCVICDINTPPASADSSIEAQTIERAKPLIATARYLLLHCGGEPMFSKYFDQVIEMTSPFTTIAFATNAMLLTPKRADLMLEQNGLADFAVSIDAASAEMFRIMRPSFDFERVTRNIKYYTDKAKELKRDKTHVAVNMSICETNLEEVPAFVDLANKVGAHQVTYNHLNEGLTHVIETVDGTTWDYVKESQFSNPARHDELLFKAWERANETGIPLTFSGKPFIGPDAEQFEAAARSMTEIPFLKEGDTEWESEFHTRLDPSLPKCFKPWQETVIQPTGDVRICYYHDLLQYTIGNIVENDFFRLWNGEEMIAAREFFLKQGVAPRCHNSNPCQRCRH
jgi:MoaA/NifB/PqqE/SkfB family radical SAM enzyme